VSPPARAHALRGLLLARHGETDDNREPIRIQGFRDTPLNDTGRQQATRLAERLADEGIVSLWSSDLARASETAEIVGSHLGLTPRLDPRLREGNRGVWEGRLWIEIKRDDPDGYTAWRRAGPDFRFPEGESLQEQSDRVLAALDDAHLAGKLPALVVTHGGSIRAALCRHHRQGLYAFHHFEVPNAAVVRL
jgi:broad specificity phosphatase PhoE